MLTKCKAQKNMKTKTDAGGHVKTSTHQPIPASSGIPISKEWGAEGGLANVLPKESNDLNRKLRKSSIMINLFKALRTSKHLNYKKKKVLMGE